MYEAIFNVNGYPQAVILHVNSNDISLISVGEIDEKINNGEYGLTAEDALDNMPNDCDIAIGFREVTENDGAKDVTFTFYNKGALDHIKDAIIKAFGE